MLFRSVDVTPDMAWKITVSSADEATALQGEIVVTRNTVGLRLNDQSWLQNTETPKLQEEPPMFPGFLLAINHLHRLLRKDKPAFDDLTAAGRTVHQPSGRALRILLARTGARSARWYFSDDQPLPVALDLEPEAATDEVRLLFDGWKMWSGLLFPERLGIVDPTTEQVSWLKITAASAQQEQNK